MPRKVLQQKNNSNSSNSEASTSVSQLHKASTGKRSNNSTSTTKKKKVSVKPPKPPAHQKRQGMCWARKTNGAVCDQKRAKGQDIPYCKHHLRKGDGAVKVVNHPDPIHGKILVARYPLKRGYQFVYWGKRERITPENEKNDDRQIHFFLNDFTQYGVIDPTDIDGCVMQFAASPGKSEWPTLHTTSNHFGTSTSRTAGRSYQLIRDVKTNEQVAHSYGNEWFEGRGIKRVDVGCVKYPLPKRPIAPKTLEKIKEKQRKEREKLKKAKEMEEARLKRKKEREEEKTARDHKKQRELRMKRRKLMNRNIA
jgi:hypothetical protein